MADNIANFQNYGGDKMIPKSQFEMNQEFPTFGAQQAFQGAQSQADRLMQAAQMLGRGVETGINMSLKKQEMEQNKANAEENNRQSLIRLNMQKEQFRLDNQKEAKKEKQQENAAFVTQDVSRIMNENRYTPDQKRALLDNIAKSKEGSDFVKVTGKPIDSGALMTEYDTAEIQKSMAIVSNPEQFKESEIANARTQLDTYTRNNPALVKKVASDAQKQNLEAVETKLKLDKMQSEIDENNSTAAKNLGEVGGLPKGAITAAIQSDPQGYYMGKGVKFSLQTSADIAYTNPDGARYLQENTPLVDSILTSVVMKNGNSESAVLLDLSKQLKSVYPDSKKSIQDLTYRDKGYEYKAAYEVFRNNNAKGINYGMKSLAQVENEQKFGISDVQTTIIQPTQVEPPKPAGLIAPKDTKPDKTVAEGKLSGIMGSMGAQSKNLVSYEEGLKLEKKKNQTKEQLKGTAVETYKSYNIPAELQTILLKQVEAESGWNPNAKSPVGASGLTQFMPGTAKEYGIDPLNPKQALDGQARYMTKMLKRYDGDIAKALASYNWGTKYLDRAISKYGANWIQHAPKETRDYVNKILKK